MVYKPLDKAKIVQPHQQRFAEIKRRQNAKRAEAEANKTPNKPA